MPARDAHLTPDQLERFIQEEWEGGRATAAQRYPHWVTHLMLCHDCVAEAAGLRRALGLAATTAPSQGRVLTQDRVAALLFSRAGSARVAEPELEERNPIEILRDAVGRVVGAVVLGGRRIVTLEADSDAPQTSWAWSPYRGDNVEHRAPLPNERHGDNGVPGERVVWLLHALEAQVVATRLPGGAVALTATALSETAEKPRTVTEGWSMRLELSGVSHGPAITDDQGQATLAGLEDAFHTLEEAVLRIVFNTPPNLNI